MQRSEDKCLESVLSSRHVGFRDHTWIVRLDTITTEPSRWPGFSLSTAKQEQLTLPQRTKVSSPPHPPASTSQVLRQHEYTTSGSNSPASPRKCQAFRHQYTSGSNSPASPRKCQAFLHQYTPGVTVPAHSQQTYLPKASNHGRVLSPARDKARCSVTAC